MKTRDLTLGRRLALALAVLRGRSGYKVATPRNSNSKLHSMAVRTQGDRLALQQGAKLTDIGRALYRNIPAAKRTVRHICSRVVGTQGIIPQFADDDLAEVWRNWQRMAGLRGQTWREIQGLALSDMITTGNGYAYSLQVSGDFYVDAFEPEELGNGLATGIMPGNQYQGGVEYDKWGRPVRYWVTFAKPGNQTGSEARSLPARRVAHLYRQEQASQYRGLSDLATGAQTLFDMQDAIDAELNGLRLQGWAGLHWKPGETESGDLADLGAVSLPSDENPEDNTDGPRGTVEHEVSFGPGETFTFDGDVSLLDSNRPGGQFLPFMTVLAQYWAVSVGVPPHVITGDYSNAKYSSLKASENANRPTFEDTQMLVVDRLCWPLVRRWVEAALLSGAVPARGRSVDSIMSDVEWQKPGFPYVDPLKEIQADEKRLQLGALTFDQFCAERGLDGRDQRKRIARSRELDEQFDVKTPGIGKAAEPQAQPAVAEIETDDDVAEIEAEDLQEVVGQ